MYIYVFYSLAVEAGFYVDTGRVIGFYTKLSNMHKQHASWLVPGWVTGAWLHRRPVFMLQYFNIGDDDQFSLQVVSSFIGCFTADYYALQRCIDWSD